MEEIIISSGESQKHSVWDEYVPIIHSARVIDVYLTDAIAAPANYNQFVHTLDKAHPGDTVNLFVNNGGGSVDAAFMIADAISRSEAHVVARISGTVASAATMIILACDELVVAPFTQWMSHNYSYGTQGSGSQVKEYVNFTDRELTAAVKTIYAGFLTDPEMKSISTDDKELWFGAAEVEERWANKIKYDLGMTDAPV